MNLCLGLILNSRSLRLTTTAFVGRQYLDCACELHRHTMVSSTLPWFHCFGTFLLLFNLCSSHSCSSMFIYHPTLKHYDSHVILDDIILTSFTKSLRLNFLSAGCFQYDKSAVSSILFDIQNFRWFKILLVYIFLKQNMLIICLCVLHFKLVSLVYDAKLSFMVSWS